MSSSKSATADAWFSSSSNKAGFSTSSLAQLLHFSSQPSHVWQFGHKHIALLLPFRIISLAPFSHLEPHLLGGPCDHSSLQFCIKSVHSWHAHIQHFTDQSRFFSFAEVRQNCGHVLVQSSVPSTVRSSSSSPSMSSSNSVTADAWFSSSSNNAFFLDTRLFRITNAAPPNASSLTAAGHDACSAVATVANAMIASTIVVACIWSNKLIHRRGVPGVQ